MVYCYLPFFILPLYAVLEKRDLALTEAASDLGSRPLRTFWSITLPLSLPGVFAGSLLVFVPATGEYLIPRLLGGAVNLMIAPVLWDSFFVARDWPIAAAATVALVLLLLLPLVLRRPRAQAGSGGGCMSRAALVRRWLLRAVLIAGLLFFYAPIVSVVLFSFNSSTSAAVWSGFSLRWYQRAAGQRQHPAGRPALASPSPS